MLLMSTEKHTETEGMRLCLSPAFVFDASLPWALNFNSLFQADGGDQKWPMVMACLAENILGAASSTSWDIFFCPSDHKSGLRSDSHGDIFRGCLHPKTSLAWALGFLDQEFSFTGPECLTALATNPTHV